MSPYEGSCAPVNDNTQVVTFLDMVTPMSAAILGTP